MGPGGRLRHVDARGVSVEVGFRQEPIDRNVDEVGVGHVAVSIDEGLLHRLHEQVVVVGAPLRARGHVEAIEDPHDLEGADALRRRAQTEELAAPVGDAQRTFVTRSGAGQIVGRQR
jgi:hypothetical protein